MKKAKTIKKMDQESFMELWDLFRDFQGQEVQIMVQSIDLAQQEETEFKNAALDSFLKDDCDADEIYELNYRKLIP